MSITSRCHYNIVFSIPIHERLEVVVDQSINFLHYNPNCAIIFHVSPSSDFVENSYLSYNDFANIIKDIGNIYINPNQVRTGFSDIIQAHISNYEYVKDILDFSHFCLCASNELFIRDGLYNSIKNYDCGFETKHLMNTNWICKNETLSDIELQNYLKSLSCKDILYSHVEGSFYNKELFGDICKMILSFYDYKKMKVAYPREEIYFATIANIICKKSKTINKIKENYLFTYIPWHHAYGKIDARIYEINNCLKGTKYYSVKRVGRSLNDVVRSYIRNKSNLNEIVSKYIDGVCIKSNWHLCFLNYCNVINVLINNIVLSLKKIVLTFYKG